MKNIKLLRNCTGIDGVLNQEKYDALRRQRNRDKHQRLIKKLKRAGTYEAYKVDKKKRAEKRKLYKARKEQK